MAKSKGNTPQKPATTKTPAAVNNAPVKPPHKMEQKASRENTKKNTRTYYPDHTGRMNTMPRMRGTGSPPKHHVVFVTHVPLSGPSLKHALKAAAPAAKHHIHKDKFGRTDEFAEPCHLVRLMFDTPEAAAAFATPGHLLIEGVKCPMIAEHSEGTEGCWRCMRRGHSFKQCPAQLRLAAPFTQLPVLSFADSVNIFGPLRAVEQLNKAKKPPPRLYSVTFPDEAAAAAALQQSYTVGDQVYTLRRRSATEDAA
eukprot:NODE_4009_length_857_cov_33.719178_g3852_i0.p1 GENE.NODE_4009_length_857_cov_33.719178_g3852_i0~~NODE_4009_length_857_cov_33.719178_g3852_i0.p1  ORF type:complete len:273 (-),score=67.82 NODE_4009_length_857_cov_33.719178_g3852_i0:38-799(-)